MATSTFNYFPGYEILGTLGRSNAQVRKAKHLETGDIVAIKHFAFNADEVTIRRFQRESEIMTSVDHPNVVQVREVRFDAELPHLVMELIEGGDVRGLINQQTCLDIATTIRLGLQMAEALKIIHKNGIIHRDIKPENILYRKLPSGELHFLLTDFGVAKLRGASPITITGQSSMTYEYASPEQFDDPKGVDIATDYYSLGVVLYECLSGKVPFEFQPGKMRSFVNRVAETPPPALVLPGNRLLPDGLGRLLSDLLAKQPEERLRDADELIVELKQTELDSLRAGMPQKRRAEPVQERKEPEPNAPPEPERESLAGHRKLAEEEDRTSQNYLGDMYRNGHFVDRNYTEAIKWYRKAAEQGQANAQTSLGVMYEKGYGVARNDVEAFKWLRKAAEQGEAAGQTNLGYMYQYGLGVERNVAEAVKWYRKSAEQGQALGQTNLGVMYEKGYGVARNDAEALKWYRRAAEQGRAEGQLKLGEMYQSGLGVERNDAEAVKWYHKAAEQGQADAQTYLGYMYQNGLGVARNDVEAVKWYGKATEKGNSDAQTNLGYMHQHGLGVDRNDAEAVKWYRKAAEQGNSTGLKNLGTMYENGYGVAKDQNEASRLYQLAEKQKDTLAKK